MLFDMSFKCTAEWLDIHTIYKVLPPISLGPPGTIYSYDNIIDSIPSAALHFPDE